MMVAILDLDPLGGESFSVGPAYLGGPTELFEDPDDPCGDVDLALEYTVAGAGGVGVVQVVPGLPEGGDRQPPHVAGTVAHLEVLLAHSVADRVDRPCHVVQQCHAHQTGPEERGEGTPPRHGHQATDERGRTEGDEHERYEQFVDEDDVLVPEQIRGEAPRGGL